MSPADGEIPENAVAIVAAHGRFPGANDIDALWRTILDGENCVRRLDCDALFAAGVSEASLDDPCFVGVANDFDGIELFDERYFGLAPGEAEIMDPQHRHLLECTKILLDRAGYVRGRITQRVGVFVSVGFPAYLLYNLSRDPALLEVAGTQRVFIANEKGFASTRIAYHFDFTGPALTIDSACSSSLVSVHQACRSLLSFETDMTVAGGATVLLPRNIGYTYAEGGIQARDGICRPFDHQASGTVFSSGVALVLLKRLEDAIADEDIILAVIRSTAVNNDGGTKMGFTAPSSSGQAAAISEALALANIAPETISYIEAHGTGTLVGDPIEIAGLKAGFGMESGRQGYCALGSLKANVGHMDAAAGVAGLIKAALCLHHRVVPPAANFSAPNPNIDIATGPFTIPREAKPWPTGLVPRRAGVSSLGIGGTNAHVVLEEAPPRVPRRDRDTADEPIVISARSPAALRLTAAAIAAALREPVAPRLLDVAQTLRLARETHACRHAFVARDTADAARLLAAFAASDPDITPVGAKPRIVFLMSADATPGGIRASYDHLPEFREAFDRYALEFLSLTGTDPGAVLRDPSGGDSALAAAASFSASLATAAQWSAWGVCPDIVVGQGLGEACAAVLAHVLSISDALRVAAIRLGYPVAPPRREGSDAEGCGLASIPCVSAAFGGSIRAAAAKDGDYWSIGPSAKMLDVVLARTCAEPGTILLAMGGDAVPPAAGASGPALPARTIVLPPLGGVRSAAETAAAIWAAGGSLNWSRYGGGGAGWQRVCLPSLPFDSRRHWIAPPATPDAVEASDSAPPVHDATQRLKAIITLWQQVFRDDTIGPESNFHHLGGDSLLASQLLARVRQQLHVQLRIADLFKNPTPEQLATLLADCLRFDARHDDLPKLAKAPPEARSALSSTQKALWFASRQEPASSTYNIPGAVRFRGKLRLELLLRALDHVTERHEALRSVFDDTDGIPSIAIAPAERFSTVVSDVTAEAVEPLSRAFALQPFDLDTPLFRARILRIDGEDHVLLVNMHHIVADGWSLGLLTEEIVEIYSALTHDREPALPSLPFSFADFVEWERRLLATGDRERQLDYWRTRLAGMPPLFPLPTDRPRKSVQHIDGAVHRFRVSRPLADALRRIAARKSTTLFTVLLAAFKILLSRKAGVNDVTVGTTVGNRSHVDLERVVGVFVNNVVLRTDLSNDPSLSDLVDRVADTAAEAFANETLPFSELVKALHWPRSPQYSPVFQILFVFQKMNLTFDLPDLHADTVEIDNLHTKFDLSLFSEEAEDGIMLNFMYNRALFDHATIERYAFELERVLEVFTGDMQMALSDVALESPQERCAQTEAKVAADQRRALGLKTARRRAVATDSLSLVLVTPPPEPGVAVTLVEPATEGVDVVAWVEANARTIDDQLSFSGAMLFRGFAPPSIGNFERLAAAATTLYGDYGDLPKAESGERIYRSTPYPADSMILFHNEGSHLKQWPLRQLFSCIVGAATGGETPLVDCRRVLAQLPEEILAPLVERRLRYVRNFIPGIDVDWRDFFKTSDRDAVARACREAGIDHRFEGEGLRFWQSSQAVARHPKLGVATFFNQICLHHPSSLDSAVRESLHALYGADSMPRNVLYGDGGIIPDAHVAEVQRVMEALSFQFAWREGDVLLLDNMLVAHGRRPFSGARRLVVALGDMIAADDVEIPDTMA